MKSLDMSHITIDATISPSWGIHIMTNFFKSINKTLALGVGARQWNLVVGESGHYGGVEDQGMVF
jgi:hypothetical protein